MTKDDFDRVYSPEQLPLRVVHYEFQAGHGRSFKVMAIESLEGAGSRFAAAAMIPSLLCVRGWRRTLARGAQGSISASCRPTQVPTDRCGSDTLRVRAVCAQVRCGGWDQCRRGNATAQWTRTSHNLSITLQSTRSLGRRIKSLRSEIRNSPGE